MSPALGSVDLGTVPASRVQCDLTALQVTIRVYLSNLPAPKICFGLALRARTIPPVIGELLGFRQRPPWDGSSLRNPAPADA
jgi:hypothetical protein